MGLCREKTARDVQVILPIDRCEEYQERIRTCMKSETTGKQGCKLKNIKIFYYVIYFMW